jgi:hypothetical protein
MAIGRINATLTGVQPGGLAKIVPTSVAVGSGSGSVDSNGNISFSGASSISLNSCFTSSYQNYRIIAEFTMSASSRTGLRWRASGSDLTSGYYSSAFYMGLAGAALAQDSQVTTYNFTGYTTAGLITVQDLTVYKPFEAGTQVFVTGTGVRGDGYLFPNGGMTTGTGSYDGLTWYAVNGGTMAGTIRVYGYNQ